MVKVRLQIICIFLLFQMSNSLLISAKVRLIFLLCIPPQKIKYFWPRRDSNTQPSDLESDALPLRHGVMIVERAEVSYWLTAESREQQSEDTGAPSIPWRLKLLYLPPYHYHTITSHGYCYHASLPQLQNGRRCLEWTALTIFYHWQYGLVAIK